MNPLFKSRARKLRKNSSNAERHMWFLLRSRRLQKYKFRRQHSIPPYIVDFICMSCHLIIELDGSQHAEAKEYDAMRTRQLEAQGYRVVRFWNNLVFTEKQNVLEAILRALEKY